MGVVPGAPVPSDPTVRVVLVGRACCHLCADARLALERVCAQEGVRWEEVDVDTDPAWRARWSEEVPVTLVDGRQVCFWRVDEARVRAALARPTA